MARLVTLNGRRLGEDPTDVAVYLLTFSHPDLAEPARLSTDPTEVLSLDPYQHGTISNGQTFMYVMMDALLPSDQDTGVSTTTISVANIDRKIGQLLRSVKGPALLRIEIVEATAPDYVLDFYDGLEVVSVVVSDVVVQLEVGRPSYSSDAFPAGHMTKDRFPGLMR